MLCGQQRAIIRNHPHLIEDSLPYDISPYYNQPWRMGVTFVFKSVAVRQQAEADGTTAQLERALQAAIAAANASIGDKHPIELFNDIQWADMETINAAGGPRNVF
jgi:hypothetical protein